MGGPLSATPAEPGAAASHAVVERGASAGHDNSTGAPYVPAAAGRVARSVPQRVVRNGFVSVQVNVDANGLNIVGDAAIEPSMAIAATDPNTVVIGWRQFDTILSDFRQAGWANSHDGGRSWTFRGVLDPGVFRSDPVLGTDAAGAIYFYSLYASLAPPVDFNCQMFKSVNGGDSWLPEVQAFGGDKQWFTIDRTGGPGHGNIYCAWSGQSDFGRSFDGGFSFLGPYNMSSAIAGIWGSMAVGSDGALYVCAMTRHFSDPAFPRVLKSTNAGIPSVIPTFSETDLSTTESGELVLVISPGGPPNPVGLLGQSWVDVDTSGGPMNGNVYWLACGRYAYVSNQFGPVLDPSDVVFRRSIDGGATWTDFIRVNDDPIINPVYSDTTDYQWFGALSVAPNGRIDVSWYDTRHEDPNDLSGPHYSELYYAYSYDGGETWSANIPASPPFNHSLGYPVQQKLGDYTHMLSDAAGANLAYAATFNGEQDVYFVRLGDGNQNGQHDGIDIATGLTPDADGDDVPDECQVMRAGQWLRLPLINGGGELHGTYAWDSATLYASIQSTAAPEGGWFFQTSQSWLEGDPNARLRQCVDLGDLDATVDRLRVSGYVAQEPGAAFDPSSGRSFAYVAAPIVTLLDADGDVLAERAAAQQTSAPWSPFAFDFDVSWLPGLPEAQRLVLRLDGYWAELPQLTPAAVQPGWVTDAPAWSRYDGLKLLVLAPIGCAGDADCSGAVDFFDIDPFVAKLGCPDFGVDCDGPCPWQNADVDADGDVDFFDIDPFVARLSTICP